MNCEFKIDGKSAAIIETLNRAGYEAYLVGGCVRDSLLGTKPTDWDITTSAEPAGVKLAFAGLDVKIAETGIKHGTVTIILDGLPVEVTTFRVDGAYTGRRRPETVEFTRSLEADLSRRDFTVNALAYHPERGLIDLFGGEADLKSGIIRAVGYADTRLNEDALRILRALRFASQLEFDIDAELAESIRRNRELLREISTERIGSEFAKLLTGAGFAKILRGFGEVFEVFIPEFGQTNQISISAAENTPPYLTARLYALLSPLGTDAVRERLRAMKFSNAVIRETLEHGKRGSLRDLAVNGSDLLRLGFAEGPEIGMTLNELLDAVIDGRLLNDKKALLEAIILTAD